MEQSQPLNVQRHGHWGHMGVSMGVIGAPGFCNKGFWNLEDAGTQQPQGQLLQIKFSGTVLACRCATSWLFSHEGIMGMPMGIRSP